MFHNPEFVEGIAFQKLEKLHETSMTNAFKRLLRPGGAGAVRREYSESRFASNVIVTGLTNLSGNTATGTLDRTSGTAKISNKERKEEEEVEVKI